MSSHSLSDDVHRQITLAIGAGRKIEAIKIYREATGAGLKESKDVIDAFVMEGIPNSKEEPSLQLGLPETEVSGGVSNLPDDVYRQILDAIGSRRKIEAIKIYRLATGASLRESKEFVEAINSKPKPDIEKSTPIHPGVQSSGCGSRAVLIVAVLIGVAILIW